MSDTDKTGKQLLDSIRKTKAGPTTAAAQSAKSTTPAKPAASKPATKKTPARRSPAKPSAANKPAKQAADPYQAGRRIWPD